VATRSTITGEVIATIVLMLKLRAKNATYSTAVAKKIALAAVDSADRLGMGACAGDASILRRTITKRTNKTK
jgi:hypothetical protein